MYKVPARSRTRPPEICWTSLRRAERTLPHGSSPGHGEPAFQVHYPAEPVTGLTVRDTAHVAAERCADGLENGVRGREVHTADKQGTSHWKALHGQQHLLNRNTPAGRRPCAVGSEIRDQREGRRAVLQPKRSLNERHHILRALRLIAGWPLNDGPFNEQNG